MATAQMAIIPADPMWDLAERTLGAGGRMLLHGGPGTGKTFAAMFAGLRAGQRVYRLQITDETPAAEARGFYVPRGSEFHWQDGPALLAMRAGARLVLDEIGRASGDMLSFALALLDDPASCAITIPSGERIVPAPGYQVVCTSNDPPETLPEALRDRLVVRIEITRPNPAAFEALPEDLRALAVRLSNAPQDERHVSMRAWREYARLRDVIGGPLAARAVFGDAQAAELTAALALGKGRA